jgi:putative transposon-encoded protein
MEFSMRRRPAKEAVKLTIEGVEGFFEKTVTKFGTGAKIDCPKQYLGRNVFVAVRRPRRGQRDSDEAAASETPKAG